MMPLQADLASQLLSQQKEDYIEMARNPATSKNKKLLNKRWLRLKQHTGNQANAFSDRLHKAIVEGNVKLTETLINEDKAAFKQVIDSVGGIGNLNKLHLLEQEAAQRNLLQRTVYITYGLGSDFKNWCPVMVFNTAAAMDYNFTGKGVRILKITYAGAGISSNLTELGISPLKALGIGQILKGQSGPIFDKGVMQQDLESFLLMLDPNASEFTDFGSIGEQSTRMELQTLFSNPYKPSAHLTFTDIFMDYVTGGTSYDNVLIAFPDLDKLLAKDWLTAYNIAKQQIQGEYASETEWNIAAWKQFVEKYKFRLIDSPKSGQQMVQDVTPQGRDQNSHPVSISDFYDEYITRIVLSSNNYGDLLVENKLMEPLYRVCSNFTKTVCETSEYPLSFDVVFKIENDFDTLEVMKNAGLIRSSDKPVIIFGDSRFIERFIYAGITDEVAPESEELQARWTGGTSISPIDVARGLNEDYLKKMHKLRNPDAWIGPFGPTGKVGGDEYFLPEDVNISIDSLDPDSELNKKQKQAMPIFSLGTKNSNILNLNLDVNGQYLTIINQFRYQTVTGAQVAAAVIPKMKANATKGTLASIGKIMKSKEVDKYGIPIAFKKIIKPFLWTTVGGKYPVVSMAAGQEVRDFKEIFKAMGIKSGTDLEGKTNPWKGTATTALQKEEWAIMYFWKRFQALSQAFPGMLMQLGGADNTQAVINHSTLVADAMGNHMFTGKITTLPMFHLSTAARVMSKPALLYSIEPRIAGLSKTATREGNIAGEIQDQHAWFTGIYNMFGFTHTISKSTITSEFTIVKRPSRAVKITG